MPFAREKKAFLAKHMGQAAADELERKLGLLGKELELAGVDFKELSACTDGICSTDKGSFLDGALSRVPATTGKAKAKGDSVAAGIIADLRSLGPRPLGKKEKSAIKEFTDVVEAADRWAGPYLSDLTKGAVQG